MDQLTICEQRKKTYELLTYCLLNVPTEDVLQSMIKGQEILNYLTEDSSFVGYSIDIANLEKYVQEYYDRFFVPGSSMFVPPYESSVRRRYLDGKKIKYGKLDSEETFHVKACYEMVSFKPRELNMFKPLKEIQFPDHIAYEMAFMTFLAFEELNSLEKGEKSKAENWKNLQTQFLDSHLIKWVGDLAMLSEEKGKGLYSYWLQLCSVWIKEDSSFLVTESEKE